MSNETSRDLMLADLAKSKLSPEDISARVMESVEQVITLTQHGVKGYVIPYFNILGRPQPFYRVRLFDFEPKYKQPKDTPPYLYYPPKFKEVADGCTYVIITEGEKKAALATKLGFPTVALGGVDAWKNRTVILPENVDLTKGKTKVTAKLPSGAEVSEDQKTSLATGMQDLIDYVLIGKKQLIILFDSDNAVSLKAPVQRAAAALGFELRFRGLAFNHIRQLILPPLQDTKVEKLGLDDFLCAVGTEPLTEAIKQCLAKRSAFPRHPSIRDFINRKLQRANVSRKEMQAVSLAILSDLDSGGIRLRNKKELQAYYFDQTDRKLLKTNFDTKRDIYDTAFGQFLYRRFGLSAADNRLIIWLAAQFTGEDPIEDVSPYRVIARKSVADDCVYFQTSDSHYVKADKDGITLFENGDNEILFEAGHVNPLDLKVLQQQYAKQERAQPEHTPLPFFWRDVLSEVRLRDQQKQKIVAGLLYYMSPWLYRWRGMQLPIEMITGESGSGKSTLCELRLEIISGQPVLRNAPTDLKDWHASIANAGGLHVTDNVHLIDRVLRQRLSDEICRIITEPNPTIEMRKLYSNAENIQMPISAVFALTAIQQPFMNADLIQRAVVLDLDKLSNTQAGHRPDIKYDSMWRSNQLSRFGGREGWIAHHLLVLHRFFRLVSQKWKTNYQASYRLINFEQTMMLMAEVFGLDGDWIPEFLSNTINKSLTDVDWTFQGIKAFADTQAIYYKGKRFTAQTISDWATGVAEFEKCENLTNTRRLGHYMKNHKTMIAQICGIVDAGTTNNRQAFRLADEEPK
jgi:hypothetical protein